MLNNRTVRFVIALLAAVLIWGYVVGEVNPSKTKTIRNVPITYTYEDTLNERGLAIGGSADEYISVEISGARAILGDVTPNDISATINVASAQKGENEMSITIKVPSGITVNKQSITRTTVNVENLTQKPVNIAIKYVGDFASGEQGSTVNMSSTQVLVSGAESLVDKVTNAQGVIDSSNVSDKLSAVPCQLVAVDESGIEIAGVKLSQRGISVTSIIARQKSVELEVPIANNAGDRYIRESSVPEEVIIFGNADQLESIAKLTAEEVDISQILESQDVEIVCTLPEGITIPEGNEPKVYVTVVPIEEKSFTFERGEIAIGGKNEELEYALPANLVVTVKACDRKSVLDGIAKGDISLSIDVTNLKATGSAEIKMDCKKEVLELSLEPKTVTIEISAKTQSNTNSDSGNADGGNGNNGN